MLLYSPRLFQGGLIKLARRASKAPFSSIDESRDQGWMGRFIQIRTSNLIPAEDMLFPEKFNMNHKWNFTLNVQFVSYLLFLSILFGVAAITQMPQVVPKIKQWVEGLVL